jgi:hypothetical protein
MTKITSDLVDARMQLNIFLQFRKFANKVRGLRPTHETSKNWLLRNYRMVRCRGCPDFPRQLYIGKCYESPTKGIFFLQVSFNGVVLSESYVAGTRHNNLHAYDELKAGRHTSSRQPWEYATLKFKVLCNSHDGHDAWPAELKSDLATFIPIGGDVVRERLKGLLIIVLLTETSSQGEQPELMYMGSLHPHQDLYLFESPKKHYIKLQEIPTFTHCESTRLGHVSACLYVDSGTIVELFVSHSSS